MTAIMDPYFTKSSKSENDSGERVNIDAKGKFLEICRKSFLIAQRTKLALVSFEDWKVCVFLILQMGFIRLNDDDICERIGWRSHINNIRTDKNNRIVTVSLGPKSFSRHIIAGYDNIYPLIQPGIDIGRLDALESLRIGGLNANANQMLDVLCSIGFCRAENVKTISMQCIKMNSSNVETLFFKILPRFPNLINLGMYFVPSTDVAGFQVIADRIRSDKSCFVSKSLRTVSFGSPLVYAGTAEMIQTLLKYYATIDRVAVPSYHNIFRKNNLEFPLVKNMVGRRILKGIDVPLSLWPRVLERAQIKVENALHLDFWTDAPTGYMFNQEDSNKMKAAGIYYLLRKGSALIGRRDFGRKANNGPLIERS